MFAWLCEAFFIGFKQCQWGNESWPEFRAVQCIARWSLHPMPRQMPEMQSRKQENRLDFPHLPLVHQRLHPSEQHLQERMPEISSAPKPAVPILLSNSSPASEPVDKLLVALYNLVLLEMHEEHQYQYCQSGLSFGYGQIDLHLMCTAFDSVSECLYQYL